VNRQSVHTIEHAIGNGGGVQPPYRLFACERMEDRGDFLIECGPMDDARVIVGEAGIRRYLRLL
jgi:hypothetical protein